MALAITKSDDAIVRSNIIMLIYGPPGSGKTTLANSASRPLLLDFDGGVVRSLGRTDTVQVRSWRSVLEITRSDVSDYDTIIVDTGGTMLDCIATYLMEENPKLNRGGGQLSLPGFGALKSAGVAFFDMLRSWEKDIVIICHSKEDKQGDETVNRLVMTGSTVEFVLQKADFVGFLRNTKQGRTLEFSPSENSHTKDSGSLGDVPIPSSAGGDGFLAGLMSRAIETMNQRNAARGASAKELMEATERATKASTAQEMTAVLRDYTDASVSTKKAIMAVLRGKATKGDIIFSPAEKAFIKVAPASKEKQADAEAGAESEQKSRVPGEDDGA